MNFGAFQYAANDVVAQQYSGNAYDRHVPLDFFGNAFVPRTHHNTVEPVDIGTIFASLLRINQPSASVGHVRTEALRPEHEGALATPH